MSGRIGRELVPGVAKAALSERENLRGSDRIDLCFAAAIMVKAAILDAELPPAVPLGGPCRRQAAQLVIVCHPRRIALDHNVQALIPAIAAGQEYYVLVATQVDTLLFFRAGTEVQRPLEPDGHERGDMWPAVSPDGAQPEQLGGLQKLPGRVPLSGDCARLAEAAVNFGSRCGHRGPSCLSYLGQLPSQDSD